MKNIYYVYAYIRSKDSATAKAGTPYYIGKGKARRAWSNQHNVGLPIDHSNIYILTENLDYYEANDLEIRLIRWYGRIDLCTGILRNLTDGGEGAVNAIVSEETKKKISEKNKGRLRTPEWIENIKKSQQRRVLEGRHPWTGGEVSRRNGRIRSENRTNPFFGPRINAEKVKNGTHPFVGGAVSKRVSQQRLKDGTHNVLIDYECPHCNKTGKGPVMLRHHFDHCINNPSRIIKPQPLVIDGVFHNKDGKPRKQQGKCERINGVTLRKDGTPRTVQSSDIKCRYCDFRSTAGVVSQHQNKNCKFKPS